MRLSFGRGAGARSSAARHRGRAWSAAALPSAPLLPLARTGAVAAPPAWVGALELSETVLDESAVPSCGAHAALAAHQASRPQSFMMMETPATVCTSTRVCQVMVWYPRTTTSSAQRTCHSTPNETLRCAKNVSANLRRCSGAMTGTSPGMHPVNINACPRVKDRTRFSTT